MSLMGIDWERWYRALKKDRPNVYAQAIRYAECISLTHSLPIKMAAEIERSHVMLACSILGVKP